MSVSLRSTLCGRALTRQESGDIGPWATFLVFLGTSISVGLRFLASVVETLEDAAIVAGVALATRWECKQLSSSVWSDQREY